MFMFLRCEVMRRLPALGQKCHFQLVLMHLTIIVGRSHGALTTRVCLWADADLAPSAALRFRPNPYVLSRLSPLSMGVFSPPVTGCASVALLETVPEVAQALSSCFPPTPGSRRGGRQRAPGRPLVVRSPGGWEHARGGAAEARPLTPPGESIARGSQEGEKREIMGLPSPGSTQGEGVYRFLRRLGLLLPSRGDGAWGRGRVGFFFPPCSPSRLGGAVPGQV